MNLLSMHKKIQAKLATGQTREELFNELVASGDEPLAKYASAICSAPITPVLEKNLIANTLLLFLFVCVAILTFVAALPIDPQATTLFLTMKVAVPFVFLYFAFNFYGAIYRVCGWWFVIQLAEELFNYSHESLVEAALALGLFFVVILSFYQAKTLFPNLKLVGSKKNEQGEFLL